MSCLAGSIWYRNIMCHAIITWCLQDKLIVLVPVLLQSLFIHKLPTFEDVQLMSQNRQLVDEHPPSAVTVHSCPSEIWYHHKGPTPCFQEAAYAREFFRLFGRHVKSELLVHLPECATPAPAAALAELLELDAANAGAYTVIVHILSCYSCAP